jgi:serine/threonine-protein kinase
MELLVGQTLDTMLAMEPDGVAVQEVQPLLDQLLEVLAAAHDKGIVHRDLKPENLFLTSEGRLKVLDFGIARLRELTAVQSPSATQAGSVLGTPAFMAPEQALGRWHEVDGRTDIWAVGATAFTLLTGQFVHEAQTLQEQLVLSATRPARPIRDLNPALPEALARVIDRALSFDSADRFANARAMRGALRQATGLSPAPVTPVSPRFPDSARVSTAADEHGATLVAPLEVTSAITGRAETSTGRPVTRSTVISGPPARRPWPMAAALVGLGLAGAGAVWALRPHGSAAEAIPSTAAPVSAAAPTPDSARAPLGAVTTPAVAPVLDAAHASASASANATSAGKPPAVPVKPSHASMPVFPTLPSLPALPVRPPTNKSLLGGEENPFDRRH